MAERPTYRERITGTNKAPRAAAHAPDEGGELVAQVEYGGCVANIFRDPAERRAGSPGDYMIAFERQFRSDGGKEVEASPRFAEVDLKNLRRVARLAQEKIDELRRETSRSGQSR